MNLPLTIFVAVIALAVLVTLPSGVRAYRRFRAARTIRCPKAAVRATIAIDPWHAAVTAFPGPPRLHVERCSLWPAYARCGEACVAVAGRCQPSR